MKHSRGEQHPARAEGLAANCSSLEAQVANLSDEIAYYSHDLDDGLDSGLLSERQLRRDVDIWGRAHKQIHREYGALPDECRRYFVIRSLIDWQVKDVVETTEQRIQEAGVKSADDVRMQRQPLVQYSPERRKLNLELRKYLYQNLYYNPEVHRPNLRAVRMLEDLFHYYVMNHREIGDLARKRASREGWHRTVCDYVSGMTDRYAIATHERLFSSPANAR
jgi:dGTPase